MRIRARYIGNGDFFKRDKIYFLNLIEEIRPKSQNKLLFHLEIASEFEDLPEGLKESEVRATYFGINSLLKNWSEISLAPKSDDKT